MKMLSKSHLKKKHSDNDISNTNIPTARQHQPSIKSSSRPDISVTIKGAVITLLICVATVIVSFQVAIVSNDWSDDLPTTATATGDATAAGAAHYPQQQPTKRRNLATSALQHSKPPLLRKTGHTAALLSPLNIMNAVPPQESQRSAPQQQKQEEVLYPLPPKLNTDKGQRIITLVHVGKAGGMSLRQTTASDECRLKATSTTTTRTFKQCTPPPPNATLARAIQHYMHMYSFNTTELEQSTSFLVLLRNPVDRIVSSFRYSHPLNCNQARYHSPLASMRVTRPWGCEELKRWKQPKTLDYKLYTECYPSAAMEDFAQNILSPYVHDNNHTLAAQTTATNKNECRLLGRELVQGLAPYRVAPHMHYNYEYYTELTTMKYPDKEVLGVRMEHQSQDLVALDLAMGGVGNVFWKNPQHAAGKKESHGSESYVPSPLSKTAYQKLCCVLEREIGVYEDVVNSVTNLNATEKQELMEDLKTKCGIQTSWTAWRRNCQDHLAEDMQTLEG